MRRRLCRLTWAALALGGVTLGCHRSAVQQKLPPDPLITSKKPVEGRPQAEVPHPLVRLDPPPPPLPALRDGYSNVEPPPVRPARLDAELPPPPRLRLGLPEDGGR
jgi:hypothetical protein